MKALIVATASTLILGQAAGPLGLPSWAGDIANLSAVGLMMTLFGWLIVKEIPRQQKAAREHTERVVDAIKEEHRRDRELWNRGV